MYPILFTIGPFTLHTYGLLVAVGFLLGFYVARQEFHRQGLNVDLLDNLMIFIILGGLLGARVFYFGMGGFHQLKEDPLSFLRIWEGGLVFFGSFLAGFIVLIVYSRIKEIPFLMLADAFSGPLFLAHAIGRLGCFSAGCCYGRQTDSFIGVTFSHPETLAPIDIPLHPAQLYSAFGNFVLFLGFLFLRKKNPTQGFLFSYYLLSYGIFRFLIEFIRSDYRGAVVGGLQPSQWISLALIVAGTSLLFYVRKNSRHA